MQTVPSLIGAGTAVAAAATGLVFGQRAESEQQYAPHHSSGSIRRKLVTDHDFSRTISFSRPGTSSAASTASPAPQNQPVLPLRQSAVPNSATSQARIVRRTSHAQIIVTRSPGSRHSVVKPGERSPAPPIAEDSCDSVSSNGSWMRRLTIRPLSQHGSIRSSIGPDSPSLFSFGSTAPILSSSRDIPTQLPPNKLVKRAPGTPSLDAGYPKRRGSRAQMTLRRPATSHQRSATLQHQLNAEELPPLPKFSFDRSNRPRAKTVGTHQEKLPHSSAGNERSKWRSFWHSKLSNITKKTSPLRGTDDTGQSPGRRIRADQLHTEQVYLVSPNNIIMSDSREVADGVSHKSVSPPHTNNKDSPKASEKELDLTEVTPSKPPKRSISMQFSSPTNWISRTGSLRRRKRGSETTGGKRHVSAPITDGEAQTQDDKSIIPEKIEVSQAEADFAAIFRPPEASPQMKLGVPSPLPPLSRLSSFHLETNGHSSLSSGLPDKTDESIVSPSVSSRVHSHTSHTRTLDRASTVGSSEYHRGFTSGDDDDTDFKTDTPFDSFRTVASGRKKGPDSPLESMFDDSPPSTAGNSIKPKRLSVQEIMGPAFDDGNKIIEEDENASTPIPGTYEEFEARFHAANIPDDEKFTDNPIISSFPIDKHYIRLSLDDDDDLGWARAEETEFYNHLSPPSSMNSRRGSPKVRRTLGRINGNSRRGEHFDSARERPRSTVFDWTETSVHDKREKNGYIHRPKTVHGKQELDLRGGRSASRKGFVATHVRSQSVPVVPDPTEPAKSVPKFGTWGLGQKNVSEDWDDDFEFEEDVVPMTGPSGKKENHLSMFVPASIQATQPTVKAHSGQIRELSLLVNDLKRLCRLGREMNLSVGSSAKLWHEAEGIIALASPDEDTEEVAHTGTPDGSDSVLVDERFIEQGFDGASLEMRETQGRRTSPSSRRRSVFSPDDDIFGTWDNTYEGVDLERPRTPENPISEPRSTSVARSVMESMRKHRTTFDVDADDDDDDDAVDNTNKYTNGKMNFDTNSLKELVKRAGDLRDSLSELVRRADHITQSPARTPKYTRADGSPAFTRVFDEPTSSPTRRGSHSPTKSALGSNSVSTSPSNGIGRRMHVMIVR
ncbi:hypothetical protein F5B22DRAFT_482589 [Xylaria bambusicola]|uniref:uncharacterized protein n=1 Tax=Xylaria bambusicola TaxID=326684 RepID=UPI00200723A4|nr:uncharacterized protein F5B22DRAFT_482589 [Xylaria bambusicola]KAI0506066.1 hypothetical protein F5B22DRAFT_482589 [Xylaria bambusicola]